MMPLLKTKSVKRKLGLLISLFTFAVLSACAAATPVAAPTVPPTASVTPTVPPSLSSDQEALLRELTKAIRDHNAEDVNRLLELGVAVNDIQSFRQLTPLALASYEGDTEIIALLLEHGAEIAMYNKNQYGTTALIEAAQNGKTEAVKYLLEHGADINQRDQFGDPALNWATYYGHVDVVKILIEYDAELTVVGSGGGTALNTAIAQGHEDIEQMLRDAGATR